MKRVLDLLWRGGWILLFQLHLLPSVKRASEKTRLQRLATCHRCPIFTPRFSRCGPIRERVRQDDQEVVIGCGCFMKLKSKIADSRCWARENGLALGWPDEIDGKSE